MADQELAIEVQLYFAIDGFFVVGGGGCGLGNVAVLFFVDWIGPFSCSIDLVNTC